MSALGSRSGYIGLVGAITGALFVVYAFSKGPLTATIGVEGWAFGELGPDRLALLVHVGEELFLVVIAVALVALAARLGVRNVPAAVGIGVALSGFALTVGAHLAEHTLDPLTVPALFGGENLFVWSYYGSWLVLYLGLAVYGVALWRSVAAPYWLGRLFVALLPGVLFLGGAVVALDWFTLAGTFRLALGGTWIVVGAWLWRRRTGSPAILRETVAGRIGSERR